MKKIHSHTFMAVLLICSTYLSGQQLYKCPEGLAQTKNKIKVTVLPQVELMSIVQTISDYPKMFSFLMSKDSSSYKTDVLNHFMPYASHPAVLMFNRLSLQPRMLNFNAPSYIMLYTNEYLQLRKDIEFDEFVINRAGGIDSLKIFLNLLRDFAEKSSFNTFYQGHNKFYKKIIENTIKNLGETDFVSELESFYGKVQKSYNIILVSLYNHVGYGNSLLHFDGKREIYNTMGPQNVLNQMPYFGDRNFLNYMIRHEFSHPFVNPLTKKYWNNIKEYSENYNSIPETAQKKVCGDWEECINEFTIRAITTQLGYNESDALGSQLYVKEKSKGVSYLDRLLEKIRYYQANRKLYPTFESFFPNILDVYKTKLQ